MFPIVQGRRLFQIDTAVIDAILGVKAYLNSARSLEAIVASSELMGRERFTVASLPPGDQLRQHVDETFESFLRGGQKQ